MAFESINLIHGVILEISSFFAYLNLFSVKLNPNDGFLPDSFLIKKKPEDIIFQVYHAIFQDMAPLSSSFLMLPRELPSYLNVAYSLRYAKEPNDGNCIARIFRVVQRVFALIREIITYRPSETSFQTNRKKLQTDFETIEKTLSSECSKSICVYFVSAYDSNGAILGDHLYYYHHYKITSLQKDFAVAPKLVASQEEMKTFMRDIKEKYPKKQIQFVDIVSHGDNSTLYVCDPNRSSGPITKSNLQENLFEDVAPDATILLDACSTGIGKNSIADEIAKRAPGRTILAPGTGMFFSKPVVSYRGNIPKVVSAVHGFAVFIAYTCRAFYSEKCTTF